MGSVGGEFWSWVYGVDDVLKIKLISESSDPNIFWSSLHEKAKQNHSLIFIHGYCNSFQDAAVTAAQLGFDLKISGKYQVFPL